MNDRAYILLIIFLIAMGVYSYQKALRDHGGITLLDQYIEGKGQDDAQEPVLDTALQYFEYAQKVDGLYGRIGDISGEREALMNEGEAGIASMLEVNAGWGEKLLASARSLDGTLEPWLAEQAIKYLQDLNELNGIIENELDFFLMNIRGSDYQFQESVGFLDEKIEKLLSHADQLDLKELAGVLKDFNSLDLETLKIRQNMQEHIEYLLERVKTVRQVSNQILGALEEAAPSFAGGLSESYAQADKALTEQLNRSARTALSLLQLFERRLGLMSDIVASLAQHKKIDLAAFKEELGLGVAADAAVAAASSAQATGAQSTVSSGQIQLVPSAGSNLEALREQQKRDEELLNTMLKVYGPE